MKSKSKFFAIAGTSLAITVASVLTISNMTAEDKLADRHSTDRSATSSAHVQGLHPENRASLVGNENNPTDLNTQQTDKRYQGEHESTLIAKSMSNTQYQESSIYGKLPDSLKGSSIPPLFIDAAGHLAQDKSARQFIEYFLSAAREEGTATSVARMQEYFSLILEGEAQTQALELLDNYMSYRLQLDNVASRNDILGSGEVKITAIEDTLERRRALRRETLGEDVASAMFGDSEKYEDFSVAMMRISQDSSLDEEQKHALYIQQAASLPPHMKERVTQQIKASRAEEKIQTLQAAGNNEQEIYEIRKEAYGQKTADMLSFMENKSDEWLSRVEAFNLTRENILASVMLNEEQKLQQINAVRDRDFTEDEKLKLAWQSLQ